jgi:hypothetical protein
MPGQLVDYRSCKFYSFLSIALCENKENPSGVCWNCNFAEIAPPITFSHHYSKLNDVVFTTIRRHDHFYRMNQVRSIRLHDGTWKKARIMQVKKQKLMEMGSQFLKKDTDCLTREAAIHLLNSFYKTPIANDEVLTILVMEWI